MRRESHVRFWESRGVQLPSATRHVPQEEDARRQRLGIHTGNFIDPWDWRQGQRLPGKDTFAALASHHLDVRALADRLLHGDHAGIYGYWLHDSVFGLTDSHTAFSMGAFPASHPAGAGSAAYRGHVVAIDLRTAETLRGTATLVIPDLADPSVNVSLTGLVDPAGDPRPALDWHGVPLRAGQFEAATTAGRIVGRFYGTSHHEAGGLVATDMLSGAFGAYRE